VRHRWCGHLALERAGRHKQTYRSSTHATWRQAQMKVTVWRDFQSRIVIADDLTCLFHDISFGPFFYRGTVDRLTVAVTAALVGIEPS